MFFQKIYNRWYFSLIILPFLSNFINSQLFIVKFFKQNQILIFLIILVFVLCIENIVSRKKIFQLTRNPKSHDLNIIDDLLFKLDVRLFQDEILFKNCWYGYDKKAISNIFIFIDECQYMENKTSDLELNSLINKLVESLIDLTNYSDNFLFDLGRKTYDFKKESDFAFEEAKEQVNKINKLALKTERHFSKLMTYLKQNNYFE